MVAPKDSTPFWEWAVAGAGLCLLAASIASALYFARQQDSRGASIEFTVTSIETVSSGHLVNFSAVNKGGANVAALTVAGTLRSGNEVLEVSTGSLKYVPKHSATEGGLFFANDPRANHLEIRAGGFETP